MIDEKTNETISITIEGNHEYAIGYPPSPKEGLNIKNCDDEKYVGRGHGDHPKELILVNSEGISMGDDNPNQKLEVQGNIVEKTRMENFIEHKDIKVNKEVKKWYNKF